MAHVYARLERHEEAKTLLHELTGRDLSDWHVDEEWPVGICLLAETCAILGDTGRAAPLYELLVPLRLAQRRRSRPLGVLATPAGPLRGRGATLRGGAANERKDGSSTLARTYAGGPCPHAAPGGCPWRPRAGGEAPVARSGDLLRDRGCSATRPSSDAREDRNERVAVAAPCSRNHHKRRRTSYAASPDSRLRAPSERRRPGAPDACLGRRLSLKGVGCRKLGEGGGCATVTVVVVGSAVTVWGPGLGPHDGELVAMSLGQVVGHHQ